jgi:hypothetical protein
VTASPPPAPPTLLDARKALLDRLEALSAPDELRSFVRRNAYSVGPELGVDGGTPVFRHILEVLVFLEEGKAPEADHELANAYFSALLKCAARLALNRSLAKLSGAREEYVHKVEQSAMAPKADDVSFRVVGSEVEGRPYDIMVPREPSDGPEKHYLRDRRWEVKVQGFEGLLSLPCVACAGRQASDPCASGCVAPGGHCGAFWFKAIPPEMLGPFWSAYVRANRTIRSEIGKDTGDRGKTYAKVGKSGTPGGRRPINSPDLLQGVVDDLPLKGEGAVRNRLGADGYTREEQDRLIRRASLRIDRR